tara:strand:+ start:1727 stop:2386 length:660 start_codon:yes stop_codon:yes gene_type:complete
MDLLTSQQFAEESISTILLNLILCMALVSLVGWFYKKYSRSLGGKSHVGSILPLIGLTVFMVITVVKSSLALSLGLVGALSIVRFRTPIKEPEELGYLFLTIAIGLGFGAGFELITIVVTLAILSYLYVTSNFNNSSRVAGEYTLILNSSDDKYNDALRLIEEKVLAFKVIRVESDNNRISAYFNVSTDSNFDLQELISELKNHDQSIDFNLIESGVNW